MEPILTPSIDRFILFPIKYPDLWSWYKKAVSSFWTAEEIDLRLDVQQWAALSDNERHFLGSILAFFACSDGIVNENLAMNFADEVQIPEARYFYGCQIMMENIHAETYALLIDTYVKDSVEKDLLFRAIENRPSIAAKANWALEWTKNRSPFGERLVAFAVVEGLFFSGSFAAIFWFRKRGLLPGLGFANELICRDEGLHTEFAAALYKHIIVKPASSRILSIVTDAVNVEKLFMTDALPIAMIGMNMEQMCQYIEFVADRLLGMFDLPAHYNSSNPFDYMELISMEGKSNFFERRVSEYSKANIAVQGDGLKVTAFSTSEDF